MGNLLKPIKRAPSMVRKELEDDYRVLRGGLLTGRQRKLLEKEIEELKEELKKLEENEEK